MFIENNNNLLKVLTQQMETAARQTKNWKKLLKDKLIFSEEKAFWAAESEFHSLIYKTNQINPPCHPAVLQLQVIKNVGNLTNSYRFPHSGLTSNWKAGDGDNPEPISYHQTTANIDIPPLPG